MLRTLRTVLPAFCALLVMSHSAAGQAAKGACGPADEMSARVVEFFGSLVTPGTPAETTLRAELGLAGVTANRVVRVTDRHDCARAARAMRELAKQDEHEGTNAQQREHQGGQEHEQRGAKSHAIYVVRVGDAYGVVDPTWKSGEYVPAILFDKHWKLRRVLLSF